MCSRRMRDANRRNALKSTGPTSPEGKARSSQNAVTHGLSARATVVLDESVEEFDVFAQGIRDDLRPRGPMETMLVDRIIHISWKLRRIPRLEGEMLVDPDPSLEFDLDDEQRGRVAYVMKMDLRMDDSAMRKVQEYEHRLDRTLHATLRELKRVRAMKGDSDSDGDVQAEACTPAVQRGGSCGVLAQPVEARGVANLENEAVLRGIEPLNSPARSDLAPSGAAPPRARAS